MYRSMRNYPRLRGLMGLGGLGVAETTAAEVQQIQAVIQKARSLSLAPHTSQSMDHFNSKLLIGPATPTGAAFWDGKLPGAFATSNDVTVRFYDVAGYQIGQPLAYKAVSPVGTLRAMLDAGWRTGAPIPANATSFWAKQTEGSTSIPTTFYDATGRAVGSATYTSVRRPGM